MSKCKWLDPYDYKGPNGVVLSQEESEYYDDMPVESVEEMVLKVMAGGQVSDRIKRSAYYDVDNELVEPDDVIEESPEGYDLPDYEQLYKDLRLRKVNQWRATKGLDPLKVQEPEPEPKSELEPEPKKAKRRKTTTIEEDVD